jgi:predicted deacylase
MRFIQIFCLLLLLGATAHAETLQSGVLMAGTSYQTPFFVKSGVETGPTIVVIGGLHGDEPAGYLAARELRKWKITRGKLVLVPDAHIEAIRRGARAYPRNMNRLFPGNPSGDAMEKLASQIWNLIKESEPELVLTLHESRGFHADDPKRYGQTFTYDFPELAPRFKKVASKVNAKSRRENIAFCSLSIRFQLARLTFAGSI